MRFDIVHKTLSNDIRKHILVNLAEREKYLSELANEIKLAPQTADFHLTLLVDTGLVGFRWTEGKKYYFLKDRRILDYIKAGKPVPLHAHPKPLHEIMLDAWDDMARRLDAVEKKLDILVKEKSSDEIK